MGRYPLLSISSWIAAAEITRCYAWPYCSDRCFQCLARCIDQEGVVPEVHGHCRVRDIAIDLDPEIQLRHVALWQRPGRHRVGCGIVGRILVQGEVERECEARPPSSDDPRLDRFDNIKVRCADPDLRRLPAEFLTQCCRRSGNALKISSFTAPAPRRTS